MKYCLAICVFALATSYAQALDLISPDDGPVNNTREATGANGLHIIVLDHEFSLARRDVRKLKRFLLQGVTDGSRILVTIDPDGVAVFKVIKGKLSFNIDGGEMQLTAKMEAGHELRLWVLDELKVKSGMRGLLAGCKTDTWAFAMSVLQAEKPPIVLKRKGYRDEPLYRGQRLDSIRLPGGSIMLTKFPKDTKRQIKNWGKGKLPIGITPPPPPLFVNPPERVGSHFNQPEKPLAWFDRFGWRKGHSNLPAARENYFGIDEGGGTQLPPPVVPPDISP